MVMNIKLKFNDTTKSYIPILKITVGVLMLKKEIEKPRLPTKYKR